MHVIATAGHVDHGKSTLVRALTGTDPDRLAEERRRGLSIELGYCWTALPGVGQVAFVDVPGHERFISTMLAGVGPVPAVMFVVAADDEWMPQAAEHLAALDAFGVAHGVLVVTRSDLADPGPALERARDEVARTSLRDIPAVTVSGRTGAGLDELRRLLVDLARRTPTPPADADVRMWVDRSFHVKGAGTVVTGTLEAGTLNVGDVVDLDGSPVRVRGMESLGRAESAVSGVARVAVNLGGRAPSSLSRGSVLTSPDRFVPTQEVDVRLGSAVPPPERPVLHVGAASVGVRVRPLVGDLVRLSLTEALPLRIGDRAVLRDPGSRQVWGAVVLAPDAQPLRRRGAGAARARTLMSLDGTVDAEVSARGLVRSETLARLGVRGAPGPDVTVSEGWLVGPERAAELRDQIEVTVRGRVTPLQPGVPVTAVAEVVGIDPSLVRSLATAPVRVDAGRLFLGHDTDLPPAVVSAWAQVRARLERDPYDAPDADQLRTLGLDRSALAALAGSGLALRIDDLVVLLPAADLAAARRLAVLPQPFTLSAARQALGTTRRVAVPLLEHLDRRRITIRHPDDRRSMREQ